MIPARGRINQPPGLFLVWDPRLPKGYKPSKFHRNRSRISRVAAGTYTYIYIHTHTYTNSSECIHPLTWAGCERLRRPQCTRTPSASSRPVRSASRCSPPPPQGSKTRFLLQKPVSRNNKSQIRTQHMRFISQTEFGGNRPIRFCAEAENQFQI